MPEDAAVREATRLDFGPHNFPPPIKTAMQAPSLDPLPDDKDLNGAFDSYGTKRPGTLAPSSSESDVRQKRLSCEHEAFRNRTASRTTTSIVTSAAEHAADTAADTDTS
ncbi:transcription factor [Fusarium subglutinans]|uniref:Transcription factor n=1 Tax=Gibberella subglutinans TaxID=42677 RepID=A0A8H5Q0A3_GIBSU|nr:transcription factor [Fusarium subglutinans]KAF5606297.1 transcription factor [Fusarium subglutinans]